MPRHPSVAPTDTLHRAARASRRAFDASRESRCSTSDRDRSFPRTPAHPRARHGDRRARRDDRRRRPGGDARAVASRPPTPATPANKLRGFDFFRSMGSPKFHVAPMVDQSELAFRELCRGYGATCAYTPMIHARLFVEEHKYR